MKDVIGMVHAWKASGRDVKEIREMTEDRERDIEEIREISDSVFREAWGKEVRESEGGQRRESKKESRDSPKGGDERMGLRGYEGGERKTSKDPEERGESKEGTTTSIGSPETEQPYPKEEEEKTMKLL